MNPQPTGQQPERITITLKSQLHEGGINNLSVAFSHAWFWLKSSSSSNVMNLMQDWENTITYFQSACVCVRSNTIRMKKKVTLIDYYIKVHSYWVKEKAKAIFVFDVCHFNLCDLSFLCSSYLLFSLPLSLDVNGPLRAIVFFFLLWIKPFVGMWFCSQYVVLL